MTLARSGSFVFGINVQASQNPYAALPSPPWIDDQGRITTSQNMEFRAGLQTLDPNGSPAGTTSAVMAQTVTASTGVGAQIEFMQSLATGLDLAEIEAAVIPTNLEIGTIEIVSTGAQGVSLSELEVVALPSGLSIAEIEIAYIEKRAPVGQGRFVLIG